MLYKYNECRLQNFKHYYFLFTIESLLNLILYYKYALKRAIFSFNKIILYTWYI